MHSTNRTTTSVTTSGGSWRSCIPEDNSRRANRALRFRSLRARRFDRKYYFRLPARAERLAYITKWNAELQGELRITEAGMAHVAGDTESFSFAYLKEMFLSLMVQWMTAGGTSSMDKVVLAQAKLLRGQMSLSKVKKKKKD